MKVAHLILLNVMLVVFSSPAQNNTNYSNGDSTSPGQDGLRICSSVLGIGAYQAGQNADSTHPALNLSTVPVDSAFTREDSAAVAVKRDSGFIPNFLTPVALTVITGGVLWLLFSQRGH